MPRRTSDLLDVFRTPAPPPRSAGSGRASSRRRGIRVALGGTIAALLVCLAFTAGRGLGRRGEAPARVPLAAVRAGEWVVRSEVPRVSTASAKDLATAIPRELPARFPDLRDRLRLGAGSTKGTMRVIVFGFRSRADAERALDRLATWSVESSFPFRRGTVVQVE